LNAIELQSLTKDFGPLRALDGVTVTVPKGRIGLLGPNGAGKSTLVKALLGLVKPTSGGGTVLGVDIARRPLELRQRVGYMPEVDCHVPGMSAAEFVQYAGELAGMPSKAARARAHEVLDYVGIEEERYRLVDGYSTGMKQKVKLAQALVHDPELLFLDEPTNGLDPNGRERMLELVEDLGINHGIGIVYSSHLLADVERVCEQVVILRRGSVLAQGTIAELLSEQEGLFQLRLHGAAGGLLEALEGQGFTHVELAPGSYRVSAPAGRAPAAVTRAILEVVKEHPQAQLRALRPLKSTLEDVFLNAVAAEAAGAEAS
jgi:ABC-2 type transport system ATP-binding protein